MSTYRLCNWVLTGLLSAGFAAGTAAAPEISGDRAPIQGAELIVHPIGHGTFVMSWDGKTIYVDPVGGGDRFAGLPGPDMILVTDIHGDHLDAGTLQAVAGADTRIVAPAAVAEQLPDGLGGQTTVLANGETETVQGFSIEAVPMYNLTEDRLKYHARGRGNGYVLGQGGVRVYVSGDTEDIPEMRALEDIDVAFVCFNLPYTMTEQQAASAVREFEPDIVYPYHFRGSDVDEFARQVADASEVRVLDWY
jgi:L-ascorbate metabolism protein UlaG (beta-lactamase superfamily)